MKRGEVAKFSNSLYLQYRYANEVIVIKPYLHYTKKTTTLFSNWSVNNC